MPAERAPPNVFSLGVMFRAVTLIALALGWWKLVAHADPDLTLMAVSGIAALFSVIVAYRRMGNLVHRCWSGLGFLAGGIVFAVFSAFLSRELATNFDKARVSSLFWIVLLPFMPGLIVQLLRSWVWSVHDREIKTELAVQKSYEDP